MARDPKRVFRPLNWVVARAPLLPIEAFLALAGGRERLEEFWGTDGGGDTPESAAASMALAVGAGHLSEAMQAQEAQKAQKAEKAEKAEKAAHEAGTDGRDGDDLRQKRLRYRIRMSTRPTPYGAFAGVALCDTAATTALALDGTHQRSARPDMEWLLSFIAALERRDEVLHQLRLVSHPALALHNGRMMLDDPSALHEAAVPVSIAATAFVVAAIDAARVPVGHGELVQTLLGHRGADAARATALVRELVDQGMLLTDLRPPMTCASPARHVLDKLRSLPCPIEQTAGLADALAALDAWVRLDPSTAARAFDALDQKLVALHAGPKTRVQVDLALGFAQATVGKPLLDAAADIAELLLRLSPLPHGPPVLLAYRAAFATRYGADRRVPLLELLDPRTGLGVLGGQGNNAIDGRRLARRQASLQALAQSAMADGQLEVALDEALIARLALWELKPEQLPTSLDLSVMVIADSCAAVNAGDWRLVVGPNVGSRQAGRYLGRFADLLGERGHAALREAAQAEQLHASDAVWAESTHLPKRLRSANVSIRPAVRSHEIALGVPAGVAPAQVIPLAEISVGLLNDRLCLFWRGQEVRVCAGHMLTPFHAPHISRFLEEIGQDGVAQPIGFDWGPAAGYAFLPRVVVGRAILAPAQWRLSKDLLGGKEALDLARFGACFLAFSQRWRVPRYVYLVEGDNRLLLDLSDGEQADQVRIELSRRSELGAVVLQEALPGPEHAWVESGKGHALVELVVPLVRQVMHKAVHKAVHKDAQPAAPHVVHQAAHQAVHRVADASPADRSTAVLTLKATASNAEPPILAHSGPPVAAAVEPVLNRMRPPGSDWLFIKLYGEAAREESLLAGAVRDFCNAEVRAARCASWFFIRYADPQPHLRIRLRGDPNRMLSDLLPRLCAWAADLMVAGQVAHFALDTYERELERYGGAAGLAWAEALFAADSVSSAALLGRLAAEPGNGGSADRLSLLTVSIDRLLADLGLSEGERCRWCQRQVRSRHASGSEYRERKAALRAWFAPTQRNAHWPAWLLELLDERSEALRPLGLRWAELQKQERIGTSRDFILSSLVHMHCNRFAGVDRGLEEKALGLLLRLHESLLKAPAQTAGAAPVS